MANPGSRLLRLCIIQSLLDASVRDARTTLYDESFLVFHGEWRMSLYVTSRLSREFVIQRDHKSCACFHQLQYYSSLLSVSSGPCQNMKRPPFRPLMMDRFSKFFKTLPTTKDSNSNPNFFFSDLATSFKLTSRVFFDNGKQVMYNFFMRFVKGCSENVRNDEEKPQTSGVLKRISVKIISKRHQFIEDQQPDWDRYVLPLAYMYNTQLHHRAKLPHSFSYSVEKRLSPPHQQKVRWHEMSNMPTAQKIHKSDDFARQSNWKEWQIPTYDSWSGDRDELVSFESAIFTDNFVYVELLQLITTSAERLAAESYSYLCPSYGAVSNSKFPIQYCSQIAGRNRK